MRNGSHADWQLQAEAAKANGYPAKPPPRRYLAVVAASLRPPVTESTGAAEAAIGE